LLTFAKDIFSAKIGNYTAFKWIEIKNVIGDIEVSGDSEKKKKISSRILESKKNIYKWEPFERQGKNYYLHMIESLRNTLFKYSIQN
jgi:hypothetical protein